MMEVVAAFTLAELFDQLAASLPKAVHGPFADALQQPFELGKRKFDRIEIGAVRRQVEKMGSHRLNRLADFRSLVATEIIHDDEVIVLQRGGKVLLHIADEDIAINGAVNHQRGDQTCGP